MKKKNIPYSIYSISELHRLLGLPKPKHPMISVFRFEDIVYNELYSLELFTLNFYCIAIKKNFTGKLKYGQRYYDFDEGVMSFISISTLGDSLLFLNRLLMNWMVLYRPTTAYLKYPIAFKRDFDGKKAMEERIHWENLAKEEHWKILLYHDMQQAFLQC